MTSLRGVDARDGPYDAAHEMLRHCRARRLSLLVMSSFVAGCGASTPTPTPRPTMVPTVAAPATVAANAQGSFTFSGWLQATDVGPVQPLPFTSLTGAVPGVPPTRIAGGALVTGAAPGSQCFHASSPADVDQYEALLVFLVRGQRYLLSISDAFQRPGQALGEATPPAGGRLTDVGGSVDEIHFDAEGVRLVDDPMFLGSYRDGRVVLARDLRSGSVDITLTGRPAAGGAPAMLRVTGTFRCP